MVCFGLLGLIVLTNLVTFTDALWYPRSMVGVDIEPVSNMSPPSLAILALTVWQGGGGVVLRIPGNARVVLINSMIMTMFLWHLTALVLAILVLHPLGFGLEARTSLRWWLERPLWVLAPAGF